MEETVSRRWTEYQMESWLLEKNLIAVRRKTRKLMAYRDFKFSDLEEKFGIKQSQKKLFPDSVEVLKPSDWLTRTLAFYRENAVLTTEKAVSEALVFPILQEIKSKNKNKLQLFSGETLEADKIKGLNGECDFIFTKEPNTVYLKAPIIQVTEAKKTT